MNSLAGPCSREWAVDVTPEPTRRVVVTGLLAWFLLNSTGSITAGASSNALFNVLVFLLAVGPLWQSAESE